MPSRCHRRTARLVIDDEPRTVKEALSGPEAAEGKKAMDEETGPKG